MSTFCHGIASCQAIDKSGEIVDIAGLDITSLPNTGILNYEHKSDVPGQICGKILSAKKIYSKKDCSHENETYFWNKCKVPFVYITAELLDDYCQSGKDAAGLFRYDADRKNQNAILGFSVEGSEIPKTRRGQVITRSIARKVTLTASPCNSLCTAELLDNSPKAQVKDDFDFIFKSDQEAINLFKTGEGVKIYEEFLAKKESSEKEMKKSDAPNWSAGKVMGDSVHYTHPEHGTVSIQKQPSGHFHVKHQGKLAGVGGIKGTFSSPKEAGAHANKYMKAVSNKQILAPKMHDMSSGELLGKAEIKKAVEAGSYNAAPSTLVNGAAYQVEGLGTKSKKKDWNKRAKEDYDRWPQKEKFESFMKARMPHLAEGEIRAIGRTLALKKSTDLEKSLESLVSPIKKN